MLIASVFYGTGLIVLIITIIVGCAHLLSFGTEDIHISKGRKGKCLFFFISSIFSSILGCVLYGVFNSNDKYMDWSLFLLSPLKSSIAGMLVSLTGTAISVATIEIVRNNNLLIKEKQRQALELSDYHKNGDKYKQNLKTIYDELTYAEGVSKKELKELNGFLIEISRYEHIFNTNEKDAIDKLLSIVVEIRGKFDKVSMEDYKKIIEQLNTILKIIEKKEFEL